MTSETVTHTETAYRSDSRPIWCPGCGNFAVLSATSKAFAALSLAPEQIVMVSGIGCSSRIPYLFRTYGVHGLHGRSIPLATGVKLARPDLTVVVFGGDGDLLSIGTNHLIHAARRNIDITIVLMDNQIYGLTKAQFSPTTVQGQISRSSPYGKMEPALNPVLLALTAGATFVARSFSGRPQQIADLLAAAIRHKGFSFLHVLSTCREWNDRSAYYKEHAEDIPEGHDEKDLEASFKLALAPGKEYMGLFYKAQQSDYAEVSKRQVEATEEFNLVQHLSRYK